METGNDARRIKTGTEIDARGNKAAAGTDARRIEESPQEPGCAECGAELHHFGPGRRPVYCGRSCSSKAYRRRRTEHQQDAVAEALVSSRVEIPAPGEGGHQELLELAAAVQRSTARYLESLERSRRGDGDDPRCNQALALLETSLTGATQRILRQAHILRYEMITTPFRTEPTTPPAAPKPAADDILDTSRVETSSPASATAPAEPAADILHSPRVDTSGPAAAPPATANTTQTPPTVPAQLRLALAAETSAHSPLARGLGAPTDSWSITGSDLVVEGWNGVVEGLHRRLQLEVNRRAVLAGPSGTPVTLPCQQDDDPLRPPPEPTCAAWAATT
ncbi:hypothetical protein ACIRST_38270 [Kitasatospora sp. NPDC101447]|uniref:hypothetical protein n=1 Tax=Kitasatospora sp. NPDC101447 TaxID=3364102 RepID=UPI00382F6359